MTVWPSGLRRWLKAPFRKGVGSNPTAVTFFSSRSQVRALVPGPRKKHDTVSERLRRWTRNPLGSARRGSNPLGVVSSRGTRGLFLVSAICSATSPFCVPACDKRSRLKMLSQALFSWGTWCSGITSASHAEGPGLNPQCVHMLLLNSSRSFA